jgi:hypothetical protein
VSRKALPNIVLSLALIMAGSAALLVRAEERSSAVPKQVKLKPGKTLEDIAEEYFDDPSAADEIRALNQIPKNTQPKAGTTVKLPSQDREQALTALRVAAQALEQAKAAGAEEFAPEKLKQAAEKMQAARAARSSADYLGSRRLADETWALARRARQESLARRPKKNRFAVSVDNKGTTRVAVMEGDGVKVTAGKKSTTVKRGHAVRVKPGKEPEKARPQLPPPRQVLPNDESVLITTSIYFNWKPVAGASRYVLLISKDRNGLMPIRQLTTANTSYLFRSSLPDGKYFWFMRTVDSQGLVGKVSPPRRFTLRASADGGLRVEPVPSDSVKEGK